MDVLENRDAVLATVGAAFNRSRDLDATVSAVASEVAGLISDWCVVDLVSDRGDIHRGAVVAKDGSSEALRAAMFRWAPDPEKPKGVRRVIDTRAPVLYPVVTDDVLVRAARGPGHVEMMRAISMRSYVCLPMLAEGEILGTLMCMLTRPGPHYAARHVPLLQSVADRAATAIGHAAQFTRMSREVELERELLSMTAHDVGNAVSALLLSTDKLLRSQAPDDRQSLRLELTRIRRIGRTISGFAAGLAEVRGLSGTRRSASTDLTATLRGCLDALGLQAELRRIHLVLDVPETPLFVDATPTALEQIAMNLIGNALKFTSEGGSVIIRAGLTSDASSVVVSVRDTGTGIRAEDLSRLFERGWQATQATQARSSGSGLGLWIAKKLVETYGGRISVDSAVGVGTTFSFSIPRWSRAIA